MRMLGPASPPRLASLRYVCMFVSLYDAGLVGGGDKRVVVVVVVGELGNKTKQTRVSSHDEHAWINSVSSYVSLTRDLRRITCLPSF